MKEMPEDEQLLTLKETCEYLGISRNTLYRCMRHKGLAGHKVSCTWRFYLGDVRSFVMRENGKELQEWLRIRMNRVDQE